jgi:ATP-binding cassette subfamily B protein
VSFVAAVVLSLASLVFQTLVPNELSRAVNVVVTGRGSLHGAVELTLLLGILAGVTGLLSRQYLYRTAFDVEADLRSLIYEHLTSLSFSFYDRVQSGQLISRANSDIRSVQMYSTFAPLIVVQSLIGVLAFWFMLAINVTLALVAMIVMPILYVVGLKMRQVLFPISWITQARLADVATLVDENVNGVRVVKAFAQEEAEINRMADAAERVAWAYETDARIRGRWSPWVQNLPQVAIALVLGVGGEMVIHAQLTVGAILAFTAYLVMLQAPFMMLGQLVMMGQRAKASAERIFEVLDETPDITDRPGARDLDSARGEVEFDHVHFAYRDDVPVLRDVTLHIGAGERVALVGATGSGKTTVARLLTRFYDPLGGVIRIDGLDIADLTLHSLRRLVGVVTDDAFLFSVSVRDNIAYARPNAADDDVVAAARAAGADGFIRDLPLGYDTVIGERGYTLSGGQRQRLAIARTLLANPPILVLDDATSAIDVHVETAIHDALDSLLEHRTTLIIAHRVSTIALADRVIVLDEGRISAQGSHEDLLASSELYRRILAQADAEDRS